MESIFEEIISCGMAASIEIELKGMSEKLLPCESRAETPSTLARSCVILVMVQALGGDVGDGGDVARCR